MEYAVVATSLKNELQIQEKIHKIMHNVKDKIWYTTFQKMSRNRRLRRSILLYIGVRMILKISSKIQTQEKLTLCIRFDLY